MKMKQKFKINQKVAFTKDQNSFVIDGFFAGTIIGYEYDLREKKVDYLIKKDFPDEVDYTSVVKEDAIYTLRQARKEIRRHNRMLRKCW